MTYLCVKFHLANQGTCIIEVKEVGMSELMKRDYLEDIYNPFHIQIPSLAWLVHSLNEVVFPPSVLQIPKQLYVPFQ